MISPIFAILCNLYVQCLVNNFSLHSIRCSKCIVSSTFQSARNRSDCTLSGPDVMKNAVHKPIESKGSETGLSVEEYCRRHEITVTVSNYLILFTFHLCTQFWQN